MFVCVDVYTGAFSVNHPALFFYTNHTACARSFSPFPAWALGPFCFIAVRTFLCISYAAQGLAGARETRVYSGEHETVGVHETTGKGFPEQPWLSKWAVAAC